jgi:antagonist of KipI
LYIEVLKPGILTTLLTAEQTGLRHIGIGSGGPMDVFAATAANSLVRNNENAPLLELHFPAPELLFTTETLLAITGGDFSASCNGQSLQNWQTHFVPANSKLQFNGLKLGFRAYFSVYGGVGMNGYNPSSPLHSMVIKKNDRLTLNKQCAFVPGMYEAAILKTMYQQVYTGSNFIYCIAGPEWELLAPSVQQQLINNTYTVSSQSNRMGYRLQGTPVNDIPRNMLSAAVDAGTVQLLPNGLPVILMADHQTTGGYPRILSVISPSRAKLAQLSPGQEIQFSIISLPEATEKLISWQQLLHKLHHTT